MLQFAVQDKKPSIDTMINIIETYGGEKSFEIPPLHYIIIECEASVGLVRKLLRRGRLGDEQAEKYFSPERLDCYGDTALLSLWKRARAGYGAHLDLASKDEQERIMDLTSLLIEFETSQVCKDAVAHFVSDFKIGADTTGIYNAFDDVDKADSKWRRKQFADSGKQYSMGSFYKGTIFA